MRAELTLKQDYGQSVLGGAGEPLFAALLGAKALADVFIQMMGDMHSLQAMYGGTFDPVHLWAS